MGSEESNISRGMQIKYSGSARDLSTLTHSSKFPILPHLPPGSPHFHPISPRSPPHFPPFFLHLYPST